MNKPVKRNDQKLSLGQEITKTLVNYLKTQFVLILIVTFLVWIILFLLKVKFALLIAFGAGALSIIPTFGMITAAFVAGLVAILDNSVFLPNSSVYLEGLVVLLIFFILNQIIDFFLSPLFLGKTNNINPFLLFLVVFTGTISFGIAGAILSVPILLVSITILKYYQSS